MAEAMWMALFLLAAAALEPDSGAPAVLLQAAEEATSGEQTPLLRAWASLGGRPEALPPSLLEPGRRAIDWADRTGPFVVFASITGARVRVGLRDPAEIADRVEAYAIVGGQRRQLARRDDAPAGRFDFSLDPPPPADASLIVEVSTHRTGRKLLLRTVVLESTAAESMPPLAPGPPGAASEDRVDEQRSTWPWWWVLGGVVAAGLTGAAVWQEIADH